MAHKFIDATNSFSMKVMESTAHSVLHTVYLVDLVGNWAFYTTAFNASKERYSLSLTNQTEGFGKTGHTSYATFNFDSTDNTVTVNGDLWRFIEKTLGLNDLVQVTNRHGGLFLKEFCTLFDATADDIEALLVWDRLLSTADLELLEDDLLLA